MNYLELFHVCIRRAAWQATFTHRHWEGLMDLACSALGWHYLQQDDIKAEAKRVQEQHEAIDAACAQWRAANGLSQSPGAD